MENIVTVNPIVWEKGPESTIVGDVLDRLEDGSPRQWYFQIWENTADDWFVRHFIGEGGFLLGEPISETEAKAAAMEAKIEMVSRFINTHTDGGKAKATSDMCFISEIINDLKTRDVWNTYSIKSSTLLEDWRHELMASAGVEDESEIQSIHAELCGAENWGIEPEEDDEDSFEGDFDIDDEEE